MRFHRLDLNLLVALDALLTEQSVTKAGERLYLSQSAMSGALAKLRLHFDDELIVQVGRKMVLTPLAENLKGRVGTILKLAQSLLDTRPSFDPRTSDRRFSVVASDVVMSVLMQSVVRRLAAEAPGVSLELLEPDGRHLVDDLEHAEVDLLIIPVEYAARHHAQEVLYEDTYSCVVWKENARIGAELTLEEFTSLAHVTMNFGRARIPGLIGAHLERLGLSLTIGAVAPSFSLLPELVIGTERVATIPTRLAQQKSQTLPIRILRPPINMPPIIEVLQWQSYRDEDAGLLWLREILKESIRKTPSLLRAV